MKGRILILGNAPNGASAAALMVDGRLEDFLQAPDERDPSPQPGQIVVGQVVRSSGKGAGAFVTLASGQQGFLRDGSGLKEGRRCLVQVQGYAERGKAPPVTRRILYKGFHLIHTPGAPGLNVSRQIRDVEARDRLEDALRAAAEPYFAAAADGVPDLAGTATPAERRHRTAALMGAMLEDGGFIIRSAAAGAPNEELAAEFEALLARRLAAEEALASNAPADQEPIPIVMAEALREWARPLPSAVVVAEGSALAPTKSRALPVAIPSALERLIRVEKGDPFDRFGVLEALEGLRSAASPLPSGGRLVVEPATALSAVDVNTGGDFSPAAGLKANIEAARELPRQLRLRGLGGQIVIDFAPMAKKDRRIVESTLKAALKRDPVETVAHGWTTMGLFELQRRRERRPLSELR